MVRAGRHRPRGQGQFDKLVNVAQGAALMTGTTVEMEPFGSAWPLLGNKVIGEAIDRKSVV